MSALRDFLLRPAADESPRDVSRARRAEAADETRRDEPELERRDGAAHRDAHRRTPRAPALAVLAPARDLPAVGAAIALGCASHCGATVALLCLWAIPVVPAPRGVALPAPRRLAAQLSAEGHAAGAVGRLATVSLPAHPEAATTAADAALDAAARAPTVLALAARHDALDALLATQDAIVVAVPAGASAGLADLALLGVTGLAPAAMRLELELTPLARALALAGVTAPRAVRTAVAGVLA